MLNTIRWQILLVALAGWVNRRQLEVIAYLREENRVLKEHLREPQATIKPRRLNSGCRLLVRSRERFTAQPRTVHVARLGTPLRRLWLTWSTTAAHAERSASLRLVPQHASKRRLTVFACVTPTDTPRLCLRRQCGVRDRPA